MSFHAVKFQLSNLDETVAAAVITPVSLAAASLQPLISFAKPQFRNCILRGLHLEQQGCPNSKTSMKCSLATLLFLQKREEERAVTVNDAAGHLP